MHYREADDSWFAIMEEHPELFGAIGRSVFPQTYRAMFSFCAKTNALKLAMFECIDSDNPYSFKVLFRAFCEHYLKFMFIWTRFLKEKTDEIGREYYSFCGALEAREYAEAVVVAERLLGNAVVIDIQRAMHELYPEAAAASSQAVAKAAGQFKYRAIIRYFAGEDLRFVSADQPFLAQIIPTYALLSSFVHGGPYTDMEMAEYSKPAALAACKREVEVVVMMAATVYMFSAAAVSRELSEFGSIAPKVNRVLEQFSAAEKSET